MLPGRRTQSGALYISTAAPPADAQMVGGILVGPWGVIFASTSLPPQVFPNGIGTRVNGVLCLAPGGTVANRMCGLPVTADGRLVVQLNVAVAPSDPYVGGVRVGPFGGIYCVDVAPPPEFGFSNGFSNGFDIS
jgi:hypothetical protein